MIGLYLRMKFLNKYHKDHYERSKKAMHGKSLSAKEAKDLSAKHPQESGIKPTPKIISQLRLKAEERLTELKNEKST